MDGRRFGFAKSQGFSATLFLREKYPHSVTVALQPLELSIEVQILAGMDDKSVMVKPIKRANNVTLV